MHQRKVPPHKKRESLKSVIDRGKAYLLGSKWIHERVAINKTYAEYREDDHREDDPFIKDQMANSGCLLVYTLGDYLAAVLVGVHTINNLGGPSDEPENEGYESEGP